MRLLDAVYPEVSASVLKADVAWHCTAFPSALNYDEATMAQVERIQKEVCTLLVSSRPVGRVSRADSRVSSAGGRERRPDVSGGRVCQGRLHLSGKDSGKSHSQLAISLYYKYLGIVCGVESEIALLAAP